MSPTDVAQDRRSLTASAGAVPADPVTRADLTPHAPRVGMIRNPRSHRNKGHAAEPAAMARVPGSVSLAMPHSLDELTEVLHGFAANGIDVLAMDGGDGTIRDVLSCGAAVFGERWPRILLVPKGKTNALAIDVGVPQQWQLADGLHAWRTGRTIVRRPIVIERVDGRSGNGRDGDGSDADDLPIWGFIFGAGAFNAAIATGQVAHRFGAFQDFAVTCTAAMGVMQALFGIGNSPWRRSACMRITAADGTELPHSGRGPLAKRYLALFSTLRRFPARMAPFAPAHGDIRYLLLDAPVRRVTGRLPAIMWGGDRSFYPALGIHRGSGAAFELDMDEGFILDGEAFAPGHIRLRQGPELHFIVP